MARALSYGFTPAFLVRACVLRAASRCAATDGRAGLGADGIRRDKCLDAGRHCRAEGTAGEQSRESAIESHRVIDPSKVVIQALNHLNLEKGYPFP